MLQKALVNESLCVPHVKSERTGASFEFLEREKERCRAHKVCVDIIN